MTTFDDAIEDLDEYLADVEVPSDLDSAEIPSVVDPVKINKMLRAVSHIDREVGIITDVAESEIRSIRERLADVTHGRLRQREWLMSTLRAASRAHWDSTKQASLKLLHGAITSRKVSTSRVVVLDEAQAELLAGHESGIVKITHEFSKSTLKDKGTVGHAVKDQADVEDGYVRCQVVIDGKVVPGVAIDVPDDDLRTYDAKPS